MSSSPIRQEALHETARTFKLAVWKAKKVLLVMEHDRHPDALLACSIIKKNLKKLNSLLEVEIVLTGDEVITSAGKAVIVFVEANFNRAVVKYLAEVNNSVIYVLDTRTSRVKWVIDHNCSAQDKASEIRPIYSDNRLSLSTIAWVLTTEQPLAQAPAVLQMLDEYYVGKTRFHQLPRNRSEDLVEYLYVNYTGSDEFTDELLDVNMYDLERISQLGHVHTQARKRLAHRIVTRNAGQFRTRDHSFSFVKFNCPRHLMDDIGYVVDLPQTLPVLYELSGRTVYVKVYFLSLKMTDKSKMVSDLIRMKEEFSDDADSYSFSFTASSKVPKFFKSTRERFIQSLLHD
jgi:hypothetical protein